MNSRRNKPYSRQLKGIDAYIGETAPTPNNAFIPIEKIQLSSQQPRRYFDPDKLEQLSLSVKEHGILEPILVRPLKDGNYELVAGERRFRAVIAASLAEVPVVVKELTDSEALQLALVENLQREDLNPVEETEGILQLIALRENIAVDEVTSRLYRMYNEVKGNVNSSNPNVRVNEFDDSITAIFESLLSMNWESFVKNKLPLLKLPENILEALRQGKIAYTKAKAIASVKDETARIELLENAIANDLSLSQIRELIKELKPTQQQEQLRTRFDTTYKQVKKSKQLWQDQKKRKKLESLLSQLEKLLESESSSEASESGLSDRELGKLLGVSNLVIRDCREKKKQPPAALKKKLLEWEVQGELWVRKS